MGRYLESALSKDEELLHEAHISPWALAHLIIAGGAAVLPGLVLAVKGLIGLSGATEDSDVISLIGAFVLMAVGAIFWGNAAIRYYTTEMAVTSRRIISKTGLISRDTVEIPLVKVESIQVQQSIIGRMFNYGTIVVAGTGSSSAPVAGIGQPIAFRNAYLVALDYRSASRDE